MDRIISFLFSWIDFLIHIYIHITAIINAVIFVAKKNQRFTATTAEELIQQRRRNRAAAAARQQQKQYSNINVQLHRHISTNNSTTLISRKQQQYTTTTTTSPFKKIPNEILIVIFEFMDQSVLYHCSTVTKHWNKLTTPILWRSPVPNQPILSCLPSFAIIDKKNKMNHHHQKSHTSPGFPLYLSRYGHAVKSLDLSQIASHVTDCTIRHIVRSCPHLTSLNLSHCRSITNEGLRCLTGHSTTTNNLKVLVLQNCRQITDIGLSYLKDTCHSLETLHLGGCSRISDSSVIDLVTASGSSIRRVNLSDCSRVTGSTIHAIAGLCGPRLEWLDIARTKTIRHSDLEYLVLHCPNISRLNVSMKKPKSLRELRNQLSFTRRQLFHFHDDDHNEEQEEVTATEDVLEEDTTDMEELIQNTNNNNPLTELLDLLNRFNIQPTLTDGSAQHQQFLIEQQRVRDPVSNHTIELIAMNLKKLEHLNLSHWTCLNDKAVHMLSIHSHCLTYLNLIGCQSVTKKVLRYLSDLCERKSTCITLSDLMICPTKSSYYSYENNNTSWITTTSSVSSSSSSEENNRIVTKSSKRSYGVIKSTTRVQSKA